MNNEERVKLVFETISKIAGFEIKPDKDFYMIGNDIKAIYQISEGLNLYYKTPIGRYNMSEYNILPILKGGYQFEEIKEPLLTEMEKNFLKQFKFDSIEKFIIITKVKSTMYLHFTNKGTNDYSIETKATDYEFNNLEFEKIYSRNELGL